MVSMALPAVEYRDFMIQFFVKDKIQLRSCITVGRENET